MLMLVEIDTLGFLVEQCRSSLGSELVPLLHRCRECDMAYVEHDGDGCPFCLGNWSVDLACEAQYGIPYHYSAVVLDYVQEALQGDMAVVSVAKNDAYACAALISSQGHAHPDLAVTSLPTNNNWLPVHIPTLDDLKEAWSEILEDVIVMVHDMSQLQRVFLLQPAFILCFCMNQCTMTVDTRYKVCADIFSRAHDARRLDFNSYHMVLFRRSTT